MNDPPNRNDTGPASGPNPDCLMRRLPQMRRFLRQRGFNEAVAERAIDRVIQAALPHLEAAKQGHCALEDHVNWLFGSLREAARQEASRQPACDFCDPASMVSLVAPGSQSEAIWAAMEQLTERQRQAVYYCVLRGLTLEEAANEMFCSPGTVRGHRAAGLDRLAIILPPLLEDGR